MMYNRIELVLKRNLGIFNKLTIKSIQKLHFRHDFKQIISEIVRLLPYPPQKKLKYLFRKRYILSFESVIKN
jgi:hypothetical protein